jgi:hypothetical protein
MKDERVCNLLPCVPLASTVCVAVVPQVLQIHGTLAGRHLVDVCYHSMGADVPRMSLYRETTLQAQMCWRDGGITLSLSFLEQTNIGCMLHPCMRNARKVLCL